MGFSSTAQRPHISGYWWRLQSFVRRYPELTVEELRLYHVQEWVDGHNIARDATKLHPRCQAEHQMGPPPRLLNRVPQKLITTTSRSVDFIRAADARYYSTIEGRGPRMRIIEGMWITDCSRHPPAFQFPLPLRRATSVLAWARI